MKRLQGLSGAKLRAFFTDLYADLRDRRLLPLIALLIVGIVAAPILLKDKSEPEPAPVSPVGGASGTSATSFDVVAATPEQSPYQKRLADRKAKDPFQPVVVEESTEGQGGGGTVEENGSAEGESGGTGSESVTVTQEEFTESTPSKPQVRYVPVPVSYGIDVLVGVPGHAHEEPAVKPQSKLPSPKNPVVIYMGPSKDKKHALFLPSSQVLGYTGPVHCAAEKANCQLLEVGLGAPVNFLYGGKERHLTLTVERFVPIVQLPNGKERVVRAGK